MIDPSAAYAAAVTSELLPNAELVVDHFHLVKLANDALTAVRRRVTFDAHGRRGRKQDQVGQPAPSADRARTPGPKALRVDVERPDRQRPQLPDPVGLHRQEELRQLLAAAADRADDAEIRTRLSPVLQLVRRYRHPELHRLATTIETWWPAILAFLHTGLSNARTEGFNRLVKQVKRVACGFRNTENSRRRIRFHCTRAQRPAPDSPPRSCPLNFEEPVSHGIAMPGCVQPTRRAGADPNGPVCRPAPRPAESAGLARCRRRWPAGRLRGRRGRRRNAGRRHPDGGGDSSGNHGVDDGLRRLPLSFRHVDALLSAKNQATQFFTHRVDVGAEMSAGNQDVPAFLGFVDIDMPGAHALRSCR